MRWKTVLVGVSAMAVLLWTLALSQHMVLHPVSGGEQAGMAAHPQSAGERARKHLASLATIAAGAALFTVFPRVQRRRSRSVVSIERSRGAKVSCPDCEREMRRVMIAGGEHRGRTMWLCPQSPDCQVPATLTRQRRMRQA